MDEPVPDSGKSFPGKLWMGVAKLIGYSLAGFANDFQAPHDGSRTEFIRQKFFRAKSIGCS